jgi:hypothetical protein
MIVRAAPLVVCLFWLAYESHFNPSFFLSTVKQGLASMVGGLEDVMVADRSGQPNDKQRLIKTALANDGSL